MPRSLKKGPYIEPKLMNRVLMAQESRFRCLSRKIWWAINWVNSHRPERFTGIPEIRSLN